MNKINTEPIVSNLNKNNNNNNGDSCDSSSDLETGPISDDDDESITYQHKTSSLTNKNVSYSSTSTPFLNGNNNNNQIPDKDVDEKKLEAEKSPKVLSLDAIRKKQAKYLNMSLFDSSSSTSQLSSLFTTSESSSSNPDQSDRSINDEKMVKNYAQMIFDSLLTNNLTLMTNSQTNSTTTTQNSFQNSSNKPVAFKSESSFNQSQNNSSILSNNLNKKWFDILASSSETDDDKSLKQIKCSSNSSLSQGPLSSSSNNSSKTHQNKVVEEDESENDETLSQCSSNSFLHSLNQYPINSINSVSSSILINDSMTEKLSTNNKNQGPNQSLEKTLEMCKSISVNNDQEDDEKSLDLLKDMDQTSSKGGLFDRFLKSYSGSGGQTAESATSVMDEPEISFVSCKTATSEQNSPKKIEENNKNVDNYSQKFTQLNSDYSSTYCSSSSSSNISRNQSSSSSNTSLSLTQIQKKELSKQFANISPIDFGSNLKCIDSFMVTTTIPYESKSTSLIHGKIDEEEEETDSLSDRTLSSNNSSLIEGKLKRKVSKSNNNSISIVMEKHSTTENQYQQQLTTVSPLNSVLKKSNELSLVSFEQHELSRAMESFLSKNDQSNSKKPLYSSSMLTESSDSQSSCSLNSNGDEKMKYLKILKEKLLKNTSAPLFNSTPMFLNNSLGNHFNREKSLNYNETIYECPNENNHHNILLNNSSRNCPSVKFNNADLDEVN